MNRFEYLAPESTEAAVGEFFGREDACLLAGGTDLIPLLKSGIRKPSCLLNLGGIRDLKQILMRRDGLFIGSMVTLSELAESPIVQQHIPVLGECARRVAAPQIRNQGTVGGNLLQERRCHYFNQSEAWRKSLAPCFQLGGGVCHQAPSSSVCRALYYSDLAPVLLSFDAAATILGEGGAKTLSIQAIIHEHVAGPRGRFILTGVLIPPFAPQTWAKFWKLSVRSAIDFPLINVALRYSPAVPGTREEPIARIFVGAASPEPFALEETARILSQPEILSSREERVNAALEEATGKMALIRETAVSPQTKRQSLQILRRALEGWRAAP